MIITKSIRLILLMLVFSLNAFSQNTLKVQSGATILLNGGAVLSLQDIDLDNDGTLNPAAPFISLTRLAMCRTRKN